MQPQKVLIVEDEGVVALSLQIMLKKIGYEVVGIAVTGEDAVLLAKNLKPDVILMDIHLKGDMDGIQATKEINMITDVPVIYLTAYADDDTVKRALKTESCSYLVKPFNPREVYSNIEFAIHRHRMSKCSSSHRNDVELQLTQSSSAGIIIDLKGRVVFTNPETEVLTGWKREELMGRNIFDTLSINPGNQPEDGHTITQIYLLGAIHYLPSRATIQTRSGKVRAVRLWSGLVKEDEGNLKNIVLVMEESPFTDL
jgi:two-component system cell cycle sensor histidine kinase/response regulator CckA